MRNLLLCIFCTLCFAAHAHAQYGRGFNRPDIAPIIGAHHTASKTTASNQRPYKISEANVLGILLYMHLYYSGNRGGTFDTVTKYWTWNCDEIDGASFYLGEPNVDDDAYQWYTYNTAGRIATWRREWGSMHDSSEYIYDSLGRCIQDLWMSRDTSGVWNYNRKIRYEYDADGKLAQDIWLWWTGTAWSGYVRHIYLYDAAGQLIRNSQQGYSWTSGWQNQEIYHYEYDAADSIVYMVREVAMAGIDTLEVTIFNNTGPFGQPENTILLSNNSWGTGPLVNKIQHTYTYTSDGMPATETQSLWDVPTSTWAMQTRYEYFYETYDTTTPPPTEIAEQSEGKLKIYPVPAREKLTIAFSSTSPTLLSFSITDMSGRLYQSWSTKRTAEYTESISMSNLPVGTYVLECNSSTGTERKKFVVEK